MRDKPAPLLLTIALAAFAPSAIAAALEDVKAIPHLDPSGEAAYRAFLAADGHRAFAIAPGGAWAWKSEAASAESAAEETLDNCEFESGRRCVLYALDNRVVFDSRDWAGLWGPYLDHAAAQRAPEGTHRGERFYDLAFREPSGRPMKLSDLRGSVVVLHFWGSWCPPCRREMPELQQLHRALGDSSGIKMVLLQVREEVSAARQWASAQHLSLPLHDSGAGEETDDALPLAGGATIHDRAIAEVFPTTYVLDRNGVVVFSHVGPITRWPEYLPLLRDVANRSGK
jgi:thiol-disulfide isomerase/thioredoxin